VCAGWPPLPSHVDLRAHVEQLASAVSPPPPAIPLRTVAAVMVFLAAHPERRDGGDALLVDALRHAFDGNFPADVIAWLTGRRRSPGTRRRRHGASHPRRSDARPSAADKRP
jgi:hypothetical protein